MKPSEMMVGVTLLLDSSIHPDERGKAFYSLEGVTDEMYEWALLLITVLDTISDGEAEFLWQDFAESLALFADAGSVESVSKLEMLTEFFADEFHERRIDFYE